MLTNAIKEAESLLNENVSRDPEYLESFIDRAKQTTSDLRYMMQSAGLRFADFNYVQADDYLTELTSKIPHAEAILESVRHEIPQDIVEGNLDEFGELDIEQTVNKTALKVAVETLGMTTSSRMLTGHTEFEEKIAIQLPEGYREFPREKFMEKLEEYVKMDDVKLAETVQKEFPTKEWIGPEPEPAVEHIPTDFEKEPDERTRANPADSSTDDEFEKNIEKERKFRGIDKAEDLSPDTGFKDDKKSSGLDKTAEDPSKEYKGDNTKNVGENSEGVAESSPGSEPSNSGDGAQLETEAPTGGESFESKIDSEANKSHGAPRGPNRRTNKDVPAYSTPKDRLTAAARLADSYENMDEKTALEIVTTVLGDTEKE